MWKACKFADGSINLSSLILHMTPFISQENKVRSSGCILGNFIKETNSFSTFFRSFCHLFLLIYTISVFFVQLQGKIGSDDFIFGNSRLFTFGWHNIKDHFYKYSI